MPQQYRSALATVRMGKSAAQSQQNGTQDADGRRQVMPRAGESPATPVGYPIAAGADLPAAVCIACGWLGDNVGYCQRCLSTPVIPRPAKGWRCIEKMEA